MNYRRSRGILRRLQEPFRVGREGSACSGEEANKNAAQWGWNFRRWDRATLRGLADGDSCEAT